MTAKMVELHGGPVHVGGLAVENLNHFGMTNQDHPTPTRLPKEFVEGYKTWPIGGSGFDTEN